MNDIRKRVCFVTSHPIQYQVPVFRHLAASAEVDLTVFFAQIPDAAKQGEGFGVAFEWDIPLLSGYHFEVLKNVSQIPSVTTFSGCDTPELMARIHRDSFDAVVVNGWGTKTSLQALWACKRSGVPCVVRGESNDLGRRPWWKRVLQRQLVLQYSACLSIGLENRRFYLNRSVQERKIFSSPYCVDNERFSRAAQDLDRHATRRKVGLGDDATVFLFCGKFITKKHPLGLLQALRIARAAGSEIELIMVGDGELRQECEEFAVAHSLPVRFFGFLNQSQIVEAYVASNCLILPSDSGETWGLVVNEAMACGLPAIVSSEVGCAADLVLPGQTGEVFQSGNWEELAVLMQKSADRPEQITAWGIAARQLVQKYTPLAAAEGIEHAVKYVCSRHAESRLPA